MIVNISISTELLKQRSRQYLLIHIFIYDLQMLRPPQFDNEWGGRKRLSQANIIVNKKAIKSISHHKLHRIWSITRFGVQTVRIDSLITNLCRHINFNIFRRTAQGGMSNFAIMSLFVAVCTVVNINVKW